MTVASVKPKAYWYLDEALDVIAQRAPQPAARIS
jgi:hypothetical protein